MCVSVGPRAVCWCNREEGKKEKHSGELHRNMKDGNAVGRSTVTLGEVLAFNVTAWYHLGKHSEMTVPVLSAHGTLINFFRTHSGTARLFGQHLPCGLI